MTIKHDRYDELEPEYLDIVAGGGTKVLNRSSKWGFPTYRNSSHHYETMSDVIPGAGIKDANRLVGEFNAPTAEGLWGHGNDPKAEHGWVAEPHTGLPIGSVTLKHGVHENGHAWAENETNALHPFHGTVRREVVGSDEEGYRIHTTGHGEGAGQIPLFGGTRNWINAEYGPEVFQKLDDNMMAQWGKERAARDAAAREHPAAPDQNEEHK